MQQGSTYLHCQHWNVGLDNLLLIMDVTLCMYVCLQLKVIMALKESFKKWAIEAGI